AKRRLTCAIASSVMSIISSRMLTEARSHAGVARGLGFGCVSAQGTRARRPSSPRFSPRVRSPGGGAGAAELHVSAPASEGAGARLDFRILGPLEVLREGALVEVGPRKLRALLALLVFNAGRVVSADRLIEELWAGSPPPGAAKTLRSYVSRL